MPFACSLLPQGVNTIWVEVFDERSFTMDELIAWTQVLIPKQVMQGETHEDWYPLSGKQGEGVEGMINLVLSYVGAPQTYLYPQAPAPVMVVPNVGGIPQRPLKVYTAPVEAAPHTVAVLSESELKQVRNYIWMTKYKINNELPILDRGNVP